MKNQQLSYVYLCSSVRHAYLAMGLANDAPEFDHHLIFINQTNAESNATIALYKKDKRPFSSVTVYEDERGFAAKYRSKRHAFKRLQRVIDELQPVKIFAGNDRRVEFQYAMHFCALRGMATQGAYLDDGTASYINGRYIRKIRAATDLTIDRVLKKVFYGNWYDKDLLMGGTKWVDECYLNLPYLAPERLERSKNIVELKPETYRNASFLALAERFIEGENTDQSEDIFKQAYDAFLILPHSKFIRTNFPSAAYYNEAVNKYIAKFKNIAVKYHPRENDFYFKSDANITVFPASIPAEVLFSFVKTDCVVGDLSSALLSAIWLLPDCKAICLCPGSLKESPIVDIVKQTKVELEYC